AAEGVPRAPRRVRYDLRALRLAREPLDALLARRGLRHRRVQERDRLALPQMAGENADLPEDARRPFLVLQEPERIAHVSSALRAFGGEHAQDVGNEEADRGFLFGAKEAEP